VANRSVKESIITMKKACKHERVVLYFIMGLRNTRRQFWNFRRCWLLATRSTKKFIKGLVCLGGGSPHTWCWGSLFKLEGDLEVIFILPKNAWSWLPSAGCIAWCFAELESENLVCMCVLKSPCKKGRGVDLSEMQWEIFFPSRDLAATGVWTFYPGWVLSTL